MRVETCGVALFLTVGFMFVFLVALTVKVDILKTEAIERGYALHCPQNGKWRWIGEC